MVSVAVLGARGYLGRELIRMLLQHPNVETLVPVTSGAPGQEYGDTVASFRGRTGLTMKNAGDPAVRDADVHFLAVDGEEAIGHVAHVEASPPQLLVDLSRGHRAAAFLPNSGWTYGLSELFGLPKGTKKIANPGCYPTATLLAAAPALKSGLVAPGPLIADGKSGVSGAGATPRPDLHYAEAHDSVRAYKVLAHDHLGEIRLATHKVEANAAPPGLGGMDYGTQGSRSGPIAGTATAGSVRAVRFTPHLVPMNRGLLSTVYLPLNPGASAEALKAVYQKAYASTAFVRMVAEPETAHVRNSNFADIAVDADLDSGLLVARGVIDNLVKGGSGQAVQNMNLAFGWPETAGLPVAGGGP